MKHINLSFAACGFLGIYHLGAASALCNHGRKLLKDVKACSGASAGSLVASVLLTAPQKIEECNKFTYDFAEEIRRQSFGALTPGYDLMARLRSGVESILPANAHELAHGRLHVSITNTRTGQNCLVSSFPCREDLVKVLLASSFLPIYAGLKPVEYKGQVTTERQVEFPALCRSFSSLVYVRHSIISGDISTPGSQVIPLRRLSSWSAYICSLSLSLSALPEVGGRKLHQQPASPASRPHGDHLPVQWATRHLPTG
nr:patatin-like phospholipase domain-containing protein 4 isoform X2 [Bubalus bubalis]XP_025132433.1 patatin-like phospholipase domain-containing protein 4 isoform X2 [Bubalus bubalis]XP_025132434.1 patatin-like phospholipase domain-containing protein 4 isoform X2 [Bubalus bubalis]XP_025132435.1 patatin-like phospholipase domain-containing protein 4 isoform X2 [Bubalus bubalis]